MGYFCLVSSARGSWDMKLGDSKHVTRPGRTQLHGLQRSAFHLAFLHLEKHFKTNKREKKMNLELKCIQQLTYFDRFSVNLFPVQVRYVFFQQLHKTHLLKATRPQPFPLRERFPKCLSGSRWEIALQQRLVRISMLKQEHPTTSCS